MNLRAALAELTAGLHGITDTPELDAQVALAHALNQSRTWILSRLDAPLSTPEADSVRQALAKLQSGTPLPYLLGHWEFFGLDFIVTPDVLIPRPETELLIEHALAFLKSRERAHASPLRAADIGAGSGCIAVTLAHHVPSLRVTATDLSLPALEVTKRNAKKHNVAGRVDLVQCDLLPPHPNPLPTASHFNLICANLPYVPSHIVPSLPIFGREPLLALDGGPNGLDIIQRLLKTAPEWLAPRGLILLEIEASLGMQALSLAYDMFSEATIHLHQDLTGKDRLVEIALP
ncbi:MAG: Release factor glutamine methyltransferase [Anaerolineales bacterium]|nr:Release factor glutamine methyltransferase [Anaerolineales bacterium]